MDLTAPLPHIQFVDLGVSSSFNPGAEGGGGSKPRDHWPDPAVCKSFNKSRARSLALLLESFVFVELSFSHFFSYFPRSDRFLILEGVEILIFAQ